MFDENGNANGNGTASGTLTESDCGSPTAAVVSTTTVTNVAATVVTTATAPPSVHSGPNALSPALPSDIPPSFAHLNLNAAPNGYVPQNGQVLQLNRTAWLRQVMNVKDPTWLQVEVCREFQRGQCSRNDQECKFAHPPAHVELQNGRVIACYDSLKNRCTRGASSCKFLHPPQHLKEQVLSTGRQNFAWKNYLVAQVSNAQAAPYATPLATPNFAHLPFTATMPNSAGAPIMPGNLVFNPYGPCALNATTVYPNLMIASSPDPFGTVNGVLGTNVTPQSPIALASIDQAQKSANFRFERMEHPQAASKRAVLEKGGVPVYQPVTNSVNGAPLPCQPFVSAYASFPTSYYPLTFTSPAPTSIPRL